MAAEFFIAKEVIAIYDLFRQLCTTFIRHWARLQLRDTPAANLHVIHVYYTAIVLLFTAVRRTFGTLQLKFIFSMASLARQTLQCPHCDVSMSRKAYMNHKRLYYNLEDGCWLKKRRYRSDDADELFDFETDLTPPSAPVRSTACDSSPPPLLLGFDVDEDDEEFQTGDLYCHHVDAEESSE